MIDKLKSKIGDLSRMSLNEIKDRLFELAKLDELILGFVKMNYWSQYKSKRQVGDCEIQNYIVCKSSNKKLENVVRSYLTDIKNVNLFNKMESNLEETKIFIERYEDKEYYAIFIINFKMEARSWYLFWTDMKLTITTYQATCALI